MDKDYYEVLGVPKDADKKNIKDAYHRLAMKYHPDRNPAPDAEDRFKEISKAYAILSDPQKRADYDARGFEGVRHYSQDDLYRDLDLGSIFGDMGFGFGGGESIFDRFFYQKPKGKPKGQDLYVNVQVPLEVIAEGGKEKIRFSRPVSCAKCHGYGTKSGKPSATCKSCNGTGKKIISREQTGKGEEHFRFQKIVVCPDCGGRGFAIEEPCPQCLGGGRVEQTETIKVNIPIGIEDGTVLRVPGHGLPSEQPGGLQGDLHVRVFCAADSRFDRRGADLWRVETINVEDAVLGKRIKVPTLDGFVNVKIPPGTQTDDILRLRNKGLPKYRTTGKGDLHLKMRIRIPERVSDKERELYEMLRSLHSN